MKQEELKTFTDLKFKKHSVIENSVSAFIEFNNGHFISVVGGDSKSFLYGNGSTSFEVMSSLKVKDTNLVKGWQSEKQVTAHMKYLQNKLQNNNEPTIFYTNTLNK